MLTKLAALVRLPTCFSSSLRFRYFSATELTLPLSTDCFAHLQNHKLRDFCVFVQMISTFLQRRHSIKSFFHMYGKLQCNFMWFMKSRLTPKQFCCLLGFPLSHRESLWYFACGLITVGLGLMGGFLDLISNISSGMSPLLGWPNDKHCFFRQM